MLALSPFTIRACCWIIVDLLSWCYSPLNDNVGTMCCLTTISLFVLYPASTQQKNSIFLPIDLKHKFDKIYLVYCSCAAVDMLLERCAEDWQKLSQWLQQLQQALSTFVVGMHVLPCVGVEILQVFHELAIKIFKVWCIRVSVSMVSALSLQGLVKHEWVVHTHHVLLCMMCSIDKDYSSSSSVLLKKSACCPEVPSVLVL